MNSELMWADLLANSNLAPHINGEVTMDVSRPAKINNQPFYLQAIDALKVLIEQGVYHPGDMLPPEGRLAQELGVSHSTLREAMGYLEMDGIVERRRGVGTFVIERSGSRFGGGLERLETMRTLARIAGMEAETVAREVLLLQATPEWAAELEVPEGADVVRVQTTQAINDCRIASFDAICPLSLLSFGDLRNSTGSLLEYLIDQGTHIPTQTHSRIYAVNADQRLSQLLHVAEGTAVLHLIETYYVASRRPIVVAYNYFLTDCFNFYINRRVVGRTIRR